MKRYIPLFLLAASAAFAQTPQPKLWKVSSEQVLLAKDPETIEQYKRELEQFFPNLRDWYIDEVTTLFFKSVHTVTSGGASVFFNDEARIA